MAPQVSYRLGSQSIRPHPHHATPGPQQQVPRPGRVEVQASVSVVYGQTFFGFLPIENVFGSAELNS
jgi:hypothetical protein